MHRRQDALQCTPLHHTLPARLGRRSSGGAPGAAGSSMGVLRRRSFAAGLPSSKCCSTEAALQWFVRVRVHGVRVCVLGVRVSVVKVASERGGRSTGHCKRLIMKSVVFGPRPTCCHARPCCYTPCVPAWPLALLPAHTGQQNSRCNLNHVPRGTAAQAVPHLQASGVVLPCGPSRSAAARSAPNMGAAQGGCSCSRCPKGPPMPGG